MNEAVRQVLRDTWGLGPDGRWLEKERKGAEAPLRGVAMFAVKSEMLQTKFVDLKSDVKGCLAGMVQKVRRESDRGYRGNAREGQGSTWKVER